MKTKKILLTGIATLGFVFASLAQLPNYVPTNGIIAYYTFNGNADDESGNGNDGTVTGATLTSGYNNNANSAYEFNYTGWTPGSQQTEIYIPYNSSFNTSNFSVSAWINPNESGYNGSNLIIVNRYQYGYNNPNGEAWRFLITSSGLLFGEISDASTNTTQNIITVTGTQIPLNEWSHVLLSYNGDSLNLFINGVLNASQATTLPLNTLGESGLSFGVSDQANGWWDPYSGTLDEIGFWNRALTQDEITSLYLSTASDYNLVAFYPFNGNANDESGNGHHGTIFGTVTGTIDRFGSTDSAYLFDGQTGYISIPSLDSLSYTPITYSAWVIVNSYFPSPTSGHKFRTVVGRQTAYILDCGAMGFYADGNVAGGAYDNTFTWWRGGGNSGDAPFSDSIPMLNIWTHIAFAQDAFGDWTWYTNGVVTNSGNFTDPQNYYDYFRIGGSNNSSAGNTYWNDKLDDISIWGRALAPTEIDSIYHAGGWDIIIADFSTSDTLGTAPLLVNFTDLSIGNPTSWQWDFGDGTTDSIQYPTHTYQSVGSYSVTLIASDTVNSDTLTKVDYITVTYATPTADFEGTPLTGDAPLLVAFTDLSVDSVDTWLWEFGDGNTSSDQNPYNEYIYPGDYTVSLTVSGPGGNDTIVKTNYITASYPEPTANFEGIPTSGNAPLEVTFTDLSVDSVDSWVWDFGDGGISYQQHPVHTYIAAGIYDVTLTVGGPGGGDVMEKTDYIAVSVITPIANFTGAPLIGITPLNVAFTDLSTGSPTIWKWDFENDGVFDSYIQFPTHTYNNAGLYSVKLVVENGTETDSLIRYDYIEVNPPSTGTDLIAYYPFNGNADDESGNGHHGAVAGATLTVDRFGNENSAYNFDGVNDYIFSTIGDSDTLGVSFWYKAPSPDKYYPTFFSYYPTGFLGQYGGTLNPPYTPGDVICYPANSGLQSLAIPAFDQWHYVYMDIDNVGHTQVVYVDGMYDNTYTGVSSISVGDDFNIGVGDPNGTPLQYFTGDLDDFRIYGRRLSSQEILDLYNISNIVVPEICIVTVDDVTGHNMVVWEKQITTEIDSFRIYRESTQANVFAHIGSVAYSEESVFTDVNSVPIQRAYKYKLSAVDVNGIETLLSNYHKTMHLTYSTGPQGMNLDWDQYEGFAFGTYYIYKSTNPNNLVLIDSISSSFTSYTDIYPPWGNVYYVIEIINQNGCSSSRDNYDASRSNVVFNPLVGKPEVEHNEIFVYPIPSGNRLIVEVGKSWNEGNLEVNILNLQGKVVLYKNCNSTQNLIELNNLLPGMYLMFVSDGLKYNVQKIVKK